MNTAEMEDLQHALECVHTFIEELGVKYADFIPQTASALLPVFDFPMGEEIRQLAFECWGHLVTSAKEANRVVVLKDYSTNAREGARFPGQCSSSQYTSRRGDNLSQ